MDARRCLLHTDKCPITPMNASQQQKEKEQREPVVGCLWSNTQPDCLAYTGPREMDGEGEASGSPRALHPPAFYFCFQSHNPDIAVKAWEL